jgi:hypothetical protein
MSTSRKPSTNPKRSGRGQGKSQKSNLPLILVGGGAVLLLLAALFVYNGSRPSKSGVQQQVSGAPALNVDKERIDFGDVKMDTPVTATFKISNTGDQPLRFSQAPKVEVVEGC